MVVLLRPPTATDIPPQAPPRTVASSPSTTVYKLVTARQSHRQSRASCPTATHLSSAYTCILVDWIWRCRSAAVSCISRTRSSCCCFSSCSVCSLSRRSAATTCAPVRRTTQPPPRAQSNFFLLTEPVSCLPESSRENLTNPPEPWQRTRCNSSALLVGVRRVET